MPIVPVLRSRTLQNTTRASVGVNPLVYFTAPPSLNSTVVDRVPVVIAVVQLATTQTVNDTLTNRQFT